MNILTRILLVTISILLTTAGLELPIKAFVSCEKSQCLSKRKNLISPISFLSINETANQIVNLGNNKNSSDDHKRLNTDGDNEGCALNMAQLGIEKTFLSCQINATISKGSQAASVYSNLQRAMRSLLNTMRRAPVCTGQGYNLDEFQRDHSIRENLKNLRSIVNQMQALLDELAKISLDCDNCDEAALNAALAQVTAINAQLTNLINDFNNEMTEINNRFNNFVARLQAVINIHSTTVPGIMAECGVNARTARRMSRIRLRVIEQVNNLINYKNTLDQRVTDIGFGTHDCVKADLDMDKLASLVCAVPK